MSKDRAAKTITRYHRAYSESMSVSFCLNDDSCSEDPEESSKLDQSIGIYEIQVLPNFFGGGRTNILF